MLWSVAIALAEVGRAALQPQVQQQPGHVVNRDERHPPAGQSGQRVAVELVAVRLECARVAVPRRDLRLEALQPQAGHGVEAQSRRDRYAAGLDRRDQRDTLVARLGEVEADGAKPQPARMATFDSGTLGEKCLKSRAGIVRGCWHHHQSSIAPGRIRNPSSCGDFSWS